jgi:hypothetical protein
MRFTQCINILLEIPSYPEAFCLFRDVIVFITSTSQTDDPGVDSASNRNEYQEHFLGVKAAGA